MCHHIQYRIALISQSCYLGWPSQQVPQGFATHSTSRSHGATGNEETLVMSTNVLITLILTSQWTLEAVSFKITCGQTTTNQMTRQELGKLQTWRPLLTNTHIPLQSCIQPGLKYTTMILTTSARRTLRRFRSTFCFTAVELRLLCAWGTRIQHCHITMVQLRNKQMLISL